MLRAGQRHPGSSPQLCSPCLPHFGRDSQQKERQLNLTGIYNGNFQVQHVTFKTVFLAHWLPIQTSICLKLFTPLQQLRKTISESHFLDKEEWGSSDPVGALALCLQDCSSKCGGHMDRNSWTPKRILHRKPRLCSSTESNNYADGKHMLKCDS